MREKMITLNEQLIAAGIGALQSGINISLVVLVLIMRQRYRNKRPWLLPLIWGGLLVAVVLNTGLAGSVVVRWLAGEETAPKTIGRWWGLGHFLGSCLLVIAFSAYQRIKHRSQRPQ
jgi:hypothetical protein